MVEDLANGGILFEYYSNHFGVLEPSARLNREKKENEKASNVVTDDDVFLYDIFPNTNLRIYHRTNRSWC